MEKRYNFIQAEKEMQAFWDEEELYKFDPNAEGEIYSIDTPPPTVSGSLHIGHLFSYTQAEVIARFRRGQGYNVFYPFGFDDNGLPTERLVERDEGIVANRLARSDFIDKCRHTIVKYENEFQQFWKSLGFSVNWSAQYQTISPDVQKLSQQLFLDLVEKEKAYAKEAPVLWCTTCQTSIAQAELDTANSDSSYHYISFILESAELEVATTRPELLGACVCLFVNPRDTRYRDLIGKAAKVPLYDYEIPILADEKVSLDKGSGVVMCATFGDSTDAEWFSEYKLPYRQAITLDGKIADVVPYLAGLTIGQARNEIVRLLSEAKRLNRTEKISHTIGTHERCGTAVEIILSKQWYIDILSDRDLFLEAADKINWYPTSMKKRYIAWVENLKWDWCISRQRFFGVPFPLWYCQSCGKAHYARLDDLPVNPLEKDYKGSCDCGCRHFIPETAVLDTWATSSLSPQINERFGLELTPMSMRTHAHEIIRTWTFYTIVRSIYHTGQIPWKDLMICGFVLAKKGEKISKSKKNNDLDPKHLIETHSADVLRYWSAGARLGTDSYFETDMLQIAKRFITKLWNAAKFTLSHLDDFDPADAFSDQLLPIDRWIIERVKQTTVNAAKLLYTYEIGSAKQEIDELFWKDYCDNYIELVKTRLYEPEVYGVDARRSGQSALYYSLLNILKLYAIYVPHISESIYQAFFRQHEGVRSIHRHLWIKPQAIDERLLHFGEGIKATVSDMRRYKSERNLSMRAEIDRIDVVVEPEYLGWIKQTEGDLRACSHAREIHYKINPI